MNPFDHELGETQSVCHQGGVMQVNAIGCDRRNQDGSNEVQPALQSTVSDGGSTVAIGFKYRQSEKLQKPFAENGESQALSSGCHDSSVAIGFKAGQSADGGLGDEREVSPTLSHKPSALEPTLAQSQCDLSQMRYIVRRLTPTEAERLMGLPDQYTIPRGLRITDELVAEFQRIFDTFGAIMYEYALASYERSHREGEPPPKPPKPKSAKQVADWLKKIADPETCPDSPRYKGCGNGMATNQPRWIFTRMLSMEGIEW
jgi:site-specific DNA-cytosine methylase